MAQITACIRGCTERGKHAGCADPETCPGCQPATCADGSLLCGPCEAALEQLLGDTHEGLAWITCWLADNLGQHIRHISTLGGQGSRPDARMDRLVAVASIMSELQVAICEIAEDFAEHHGITPPGRSDGHLPALGLLRRWMGTLRRWEPAGDALDELLDLRDQAHVVAPWRALHDPEADEYAASLLYLAPPQTTDEICARFGITPTRLRKARSRRKVTPVDDLERPLRWRPWDVFCWMHPKEAENYLGRMAC